MHEHSSPSLDASRLRIAIAASRYHAEITDSMCRAAKAVYTNAGGMPHNLHVIPTAGTFELTAICRALAAQSQRSGQPVFDALVALGCVITGQTTHDQYIAQSVVQGLTAITVQTGVPIGFGVLTCQSLEQARQRSSSSGGSANKGAEAMTAAIQSAISIQMIQKSRAYR